MKKVFSSILCVILALVLLAPNSMLSVIKAAAASRNTILHVWVSDSKMGECPQYTINGNMYYLCFDLYDSNTGTKYNKYKNGNYKVTMTFYKPNGSVAYSYSYDNSDSNWIGYRVDTTGTYKGVVSLSGCLNGSCAITFSCRNANLVIESWSSDKKMGSETIYLDKGDSCYYCYKMYDKNTGVLLDKLLPSRNYTVTETFCDSSGKALYSTTYKNDNNWYALTGLPARTTYILKIDVKGDFNVSNSRKIYTKYYTDGETYSFSNSRTNFLGSSTASGKYYVESKEFSVLESRIKSHYWYSAKLRAYNIALMKSERDSVWQGSCYGMSATTILDKRNQIGMNENFGTNSYGSVSSVNAIARPYSNKKARSAINYYQICQSLGFIDPDKLYKRSSSKWSTGLKNLVNEVKKNNLVLFGFSWYDAAEGGDVGHTIVLQYTYVDANGDNVILAYDPNEPGGTTVVRINSSYTSCRIDGYTSIPKTIDYTTNFSCFDEIDIDGSNNSYKKSYSAVNESGETTNNTTLRFDLTGNTTIYNETGEVLYYDMDRNYSGTIDVISESLIINGSESPVTVVLEVENSKSFSFESTGKELNVSVVSENIFASAKTKGSDAVVIAEDEGLYVLGSNYDCETYITYNDSGDMIKYNGSSVDEDLIVKPTGKGVTVFGSCDNCEVTKFVGDEEKSYIVEPKCKSFTVECNTSTGYTNFAGSNDDKTYNIEVENQETIPIEKIKVDKKEISVVLGQKSNINCTVFPNNATDKTIVWASSDENVATIDASGAITSVGVGKTIISAMTLDGSIIDDCVLTVTAPPVNSIDVEKDEINMEVGESAVVGVTVNPVEATNKNVSWKSNNGSIASVSSDGTITANSLGSTVIEVQTVDGGYKAKIKVNIIPTEVSGVIIEDSDIFIKKNESVQLIATVLPTNATNKSVTWESSNAEVVTVDSQGRVTACGFGTAVITVKTNDGGYLAICNVTVEKPLKGVKVNDVTLNYKESFKLTPSIDIETGTKYSIEYKSSDNNIATVDSNGNVYGVKKWGKATATITCKVTDENGYSVSDTCSVNVGFAWWQWIIGIVLFGFIWY